MNVLRNVKNKPEIRGTKLKENLTLQDALIAIAVYAAQIDPEKSKQDVNRIKSLAEIHPLFTEESNKILTRIYKFVNSMSVREPLETVELAAKSLTPKYRETAYKWATTLVSSDKELSEEQSEILDWLRIKLSIDSNIASKIIFEKSKNR